jgi:ATP:ADP antiporter, AAA family
MALSKTQPDAAIATAMVCAGAVSAQFIAGKATRDALFLANLDVTALPAMVVATAAFSILLVALSAWILRRTSPSTFVPVAFVVNAVLLLVAWGIASRVPVLAAQGVYLQISGLGPMLGSGFWLIATDQFDPHTARHHFGRIAGVATLAGLAGALVAERVAALYGVTLMLPVLAALNLVCAWQIRRLAGTRRTPRRKEPLDAAASLRTTTIFTAMESEAELAAESPRSGLHALAHTPYLRNLAAVILLGTVGATLADYVFKLHAVETFGRGETLLRFFAAYYAATSLLAFAVQATIGGPALERLGLALTTSTPNLALFAGGLAAIAFPGFGSVLAARGGESVFRGSLFRTGYEIFYTPIRASEKRAAKSIIDVGFDRLGDAIGGGLIRLLILLPAAQQYVAILGTAVATAGLALVVARRLNRGYIATLERSLLDRAVELDLSNIEDITTRTAAVRTLHMATTAETRQGTTTAAASVTAMTGFDAEVQKILALRSRNRERVLRVLRDEGDLDAPLVPHVIALLAWDAVAEDAVRALRKVAEERVGELTDGLVDPNQPFAVRRRLARVFSICVSQRAVDALLLGLEDTRFEVRFQCGRSLAAIVERNRFVRIDRERIFDVVRREVTVSRPVWQSHRLLDAIADDKTSFVDEFIKDRAGQSLAHVFILLSAVLPAAPLQIAFRGLHTDDPALRGTALEYLEGVLPPDIRDRLWPFLGSDTHLQGGRRAREEILADLMRSNESIVLNLEELRRRGRTGA